MLVAHRTLFLCQLAMLFGPGDLKCVEERPDEDAKWFFSIAKANVSLDLVIDSSERVGHNITSNIFKIFLEQRLGYESVKIRQQDDNFDFNVAMGRLVVGDSETISAVDVQAGATINLEVWMPTYIDRSDGENHKSDLPTDMGLITPSGRFGWFIPEDSDNRKDTVYWKDFQDIEKASVYSVGSAVRNAILGDYVSRNMSYTPKRCQGTSDCALLLAGSKNATKFVIEDINRLELYVEVVWVGPNLLEVVDVFRKEHISIAVLSWSPSIVTASGNFASVLFPPCENIRSRPSPGCHYQSQRLIKMASRLLETGAPFAYEAIHDVSFTAAQYLNILKSYLANRSLSHYDIACNWLKENKETWIHWDQLRTKVRLPLLGLFPLTMPAYKGGSIGDAADMAVEAVNKDNSILRGIDLVLQSNDGRCNTESVMSKFVESIYSVSKPVGIVGPACSDTVEALLSACHSLHLVTVSYSAEGAAFSNREKYPYFFRTIGENLEYNQVYLNLLKRLGWKRISSITEDGQKYTEYLPHLMDLLKKNNFTFVATSKFPRNRANHTMNTHLEDLKAKRARIIVADVYDTAAREVMCSAYHLGMTAREGYVWFLPQWLDDNWYDTEFHNKLNKEQIDCTTEQMIQAINGHLSLGHQYFAPDDAVMQENITVGEWRKNYFNYTQGSPSLYGGFAYDAVWVFAYALDKLYRTDPFALMKLRTEESAPKFVEIIENTDFNGVSGRIKFVSGSSRMTVINILQWIDTKTTVIGLFYPNMTDEGPGSDHRFEFNISAIKWLTADHKQPDDGAEICIIQGLADLLAVECGVAVAIANVIGFTLLGILVIIAFFVTKHRYDKKVQKMQKQQEYIKSLGFDLLAPNLSDLDKWEIPRDQLVINRKLGEGAFGTVYGGEAYFATKGWVAAAVKALKVNSTTEQKLDFLSEAEVMKRFDHKNIVQLLGVCTKNEPVYTVMEFMLYGDLKTFLLARRHLVNNKKVHEESDEISSKKLTAMALDVARGLSYLAELKYVHRDIACRNCLINYARVVKIGDFGMTRPMFENDYYKFNRKGMMPVRWMAPESLALGIFTPSSDVWSYGVLLYEIITFGSFPFSGLSNNQVVDHVKNGNIITIPTGIKPQLEFLIKSCWNLEYKKRPQASEIVEFLANNPRLLSPCLDVPLSSVEIEDTGQLEINLPDSIRKFSVTLNPLRSEGNDIRHRSLSQDSDPSPSPLLPDFDEPGSVFFPNGVATPSVDCPRIPLLNAHRGGSAGSGLAKLVTIHHGESCDEYCNHDHHNETSVL